MLHKIFWVPAVPDNGASFINIDWRYRIREGKNEIKHEKSVIQLSGHSEITVPIYETFDFNLLVSSKSGDSMAFNTLKFDTRKLPHEFWILPPDEICRFFSDMISLIYDRELIYQRTCFEFKSLQPTKTKTLGQFCFGKRKSSRSYSRSHFRLEQTSIITEDSYIIS